MEFRVLGPLQVVAGSDPVELASGQQVALLSCLLMAGDERTCTTTVTVPRDCSGAHATRAAKEVRKARRKARRHR